MHRFASPTRTTLFYLALTVSLAFLPQEASAQHEFKRLPAPAAKTSDRDKIDPAYLDRLAEIARTGTIQRSAEERAAIMAEREARRRAWVASEPGVRERPPATTTSKAPNVQGPVPPPTIFVVNSAYDDADDNVGDGTCWTGYYLDEPGTTYPDCTLRAAIQEANLVAGSDSVVIRIDIWSVARGATFTGVFGYNNTLDVWRIPVNTNSSASQGALPAITRDNVHIDGTWQLEGSGVGTFDDAYCGEDFLYADSSRVKVMIDGINLPSTENDLNISGDHVSVRGVAVSNASLHGINANGANRLSLDCVRVGTDHFGKVANPNLGSGIVFQNGHNLTVSRSLVSGNTDNGIVALGDTVNVMRSFIGTDRKGEYAVSNGLVGLELGGVYGSTILSLISGNNPGVVISGSEHRLEASGVGVNRDASAAILNYPDGIYVGGSDNLIGGQSPGARSYVGGNYSWGIHLADTSSSNVVANVWAGLNLLGTGAVPNGGAGIADRAQTNTIGMIPPVEPPPLGGTSQPVVFGNETVAKTSAPFQAGTVVSGNGADGILVYYTSTIVNTFIGTDPTGTFAIPNTSCGVRLNTGVNSVVGGTAEGAGNLISGNGGAGVCAYADNGFIYGNKIGTNLAGTAAIPNGSAGIDAHDGVTIGSASGGGNLISGNTGPGIRGNGSANFIRANYIGTNAAGTAALANGGSGIQLMSTSSSTTIGGTSAGARNVISGNGLHGIASSDPFSSIVGNYVGTDATGTFAVPNGASGIWTDGISAQIGNGTPGGGNLISGNTHYGIVLAEPGVEPARPDALKKGQSANYFLLGNYIGTDATGTQPVPNQLSGIASDTPYYVEIGQSVWPNKIAYNGNRGIEVTGSGPVIIGPNSIFGNGGLGIDLGTYGVTPNDYGTPPDTDSGPNGLQNFPEIQFPVMRIGPDSIDITFELYSVPNTFFQFNVYANAAKDPSDFGEGQTWTHTLQGSTDINGYYSHRDTLVSPAFGPYAWITMTAHNTGAFSTSEFSEAQPILGEGVLLSDAKVFLEGPYTGAAMSTALSTAGDVPVNQPYGASLFDGTFAEFDSVVVVAPLPSGIVDWVTLSLRTSTSAASEVIRRVAFVGSGGSLLEFDGSPSVRFQGVPAGEYYLVVCHRNHVCAMSSSALDFGGGSETWDFTTGLGQAYSGGGASMKHLGGGVYGLFAGDNNADGDVTAPDFNQWNAETTAGATGYIRSDHNLDGDATAPDFNLWNANTTAGAASQVPN